MATWKDWEVLMEEAEEAWNRGGVFETVHKNLNLAHEMYDKLIKEGEEIKEKKADEGAFEETGAKIGRLVTEKNKAYGNSFGESGEIIKIFYPDGIKPEQYDDLLALVRVLDKLFRIATDKGAFNEEPWKDIAGYAILKVNASEKEKS